MNNNLNEMVAAVTVCVCVVIMTDPKSLVGGVKERERERKKCKLPSYML